MLLRNKKIILAQLSQIKKVDKIIIIEFLQRQPH